MTEIERLVLEVTSKGVDDVNSQLDYLEGKINSATKAAGGLMGGLMGFASLDYVFNKAVQAIEYVGAQLVQATREYQDLNVQLTTVTGSQEKANTAWQLLLQYSTQTPNTVESITAAFIRLVNVGLDPSEQALTSYGNIAAATGHTLEDVVNSAARAAEGQYRGLLNYGIRIKAQGDELIATFQGQRTVLENTGKAVEEYLLKIGNVNFAGAMGRQMDTLSGQIGLFKNLWDQMWLDLSKGEVGAELTSGMKEINSLLQELDDNLASGKITWEVQNYTERWKWATDNICESLLNVEHSVSHLTEWIEHELNLTDVDWADLWKYLPEYSKAALDLVSIKITDWADKTKNEFEKLGEEVGNFWQYLQDGDAAASDTRNESIQAKYAKHPWTPRMVNGVDVNQPAGDTDPLSGEEPGDSQSVFDQLNASKAQADKAQRDAENNRYSQPPINVSKSGLGQFAKGDSGLGVDDKDAQAQQKLQQQILKQETSDLEKALTDQNTFVDKSFKQREEVILADTTKTEQEKKTLILEALADSMKDELSVTKDNYNTLRQFILSDTQLTYEARNKLIAQLNKEEAADTLKIEINKQKTLLDTASSGFEAMAQITSLFGKKGFEASKALSIASATIKMCESAVTAYDNGLNAGGPYGGEVLGGVEAAIALAMGAAQIAKIASTNYSGAFATGGYIPPGKYGIVGEAGPEFVQGPAVVTSAANTANALNGMNGGVHTVTVHNHGAPATVETGVSHGELTMILKPLLARNKEDTKNELAAEVVRGGGNFTRANEKTYGLRRNNQ